jgi:hypothetical protein
MCQITTNNYQNLLLIKFCSLQQHLTPCFQKLPEARFKRINTSHMKVYTQTLFSPFFQHVFPANAALKMCINI